METRVNSRGSKGWGGVGYELVETLYIREDGIPSDKKVRVKRPQARPSTKKTKIRNLPLRYNHTKQNKKTRL